jgi:hypothetical protein
MFLKIIAIISLIFGAREQSITSFSRFSLLPLHFISSLIDSNNHIQSYPITMMV